MDKQNMGETIRDHANTAFACIEAAISKICDSDTAAVSSMNIDLIRSISNCIANKVPFTLEYSIAENGDVGIEFTHRKVDAEIPDISDDEYLHCEESKDDVNLTSKETETLDIMLDNLSDRINSIDGEVTAIKDVLKEAYIADENGNAYDYTDHFYAISEDVEDIKTVLNNSLEDIKELKLRLEILERFNKQICETLIQDKKFRKRFNKNVSRNVVKLLKAKSRNIEAVENDLEAVKKAVNIEDDESDEG